MSYERLGEKTLEYLPCRYPGSKLLFRGPRRKLDGNYVAFLGGTDTYGKFIEQPFPALIEEKTGVKCVNLGWPNAGIDVYLNDEMVMGAASDADLTVLQVPCVQNLSNRFYSVHPRRNDRFLEASGLLRAIFREVDFTEFHFTRHMLSRLMEVSPERFGMVREEMQLAWSARMRLLLEKINGKVVLLWFSSRSPAEETDRLELTKDPSFVTLDMLDTLRPLVTDVIDATISEDAVSEGTRGMHFSEMESLAAQELLGPRAHYEAAEALGPKIVDLMP